MSHSNEQTSIKLTAESPNFVTCDKVHCRLLHGGPFIDVLIIRNKRNMYVHHDLTNNQHRYYIEQIGLHPKIMLIRMNCNASPKSDRLTNDEKLRNLSCSNLEKDFQ